MIPSTTRLALPAALALSLLAGCGEKREQPAATATENNVHPEQPGAQASATAPGTAAPGTAAPGTVAPGTAPAADADLAVITITGVDIDMGLARRCNLPLTSVFFKFDSAQLRPESRERLQSVVQCVTTGPAKGEELVIVGRADPVGADEYNKKLGMSRAESVAKYLRDQGVQKERVETESKGEKGAAPAPSLWPLERRVTIRLAGS